MIFTEQKCSFFIVIHRLRLDCLTQFSAILKVIGEFFMLTNVEPAMTVRDVATDRKSVV
jgi:hypothetical protein